MRLSLRFIIPLMLALAAIAYSVVPLVDQLTLRWFVRDLDIRAELVANSLQEPLQEQLLGGKPAKIHDMHEALRPVLEADPVPQPEFNGTFQLA